MQDVFIIIKSCEFHGFRGLQCILWTDELPKKDLSLNFMGGKKQQITDRELTSQLRVNRLISDASAHRQMARLIGFYASTLARLMQLLQHNPTRGSIVIMGAFFFFSMLHGTKLADLPDLCLNASIDHPTSVASSLWKQCSDSPSFTLPQV